MQKFKKIAAGLMLGLILGGCSFGGDIGADAVKAKTEAYINSDLLTGGVKASITEIKEEAGLYHIKIQLDEGGNKREVESYVTEDGKLLFPQAVEMLTAEEKAAKEKETAAAAAKPVDNSAILASITKAEKPVVELFVMSYCPFGTQIEKGIIPVLKALGDKVDFKLEFVNYAMHDEKELVEETREVAIRNNAPEKLIPYLEKFLEAGDSAAAITAAGLDAAQVETWAAAVDAEFKVMEKFKDKTTWTNSTYPPFDADLAQNKTYSVEGSPTLVINGKVINGLGRDPATLLSAVCAGFTTAPAVCADSKLSTETPSSGFGYGASATNADGSCE